MALLNPLYLWALLGLAVPVAIHLWSRKEGRTIKVGSIQFLKESNPRQASSIKLNELWLLILRMLVLFVLVLILAGPVLKSEGSPTPITYLVEPSLFQHEEISRIFDIIDPGTEIRILAEGFPEYSPGEEIGGEEIPNYWKLAGEMQELNTDSIVVFTAGYAAGLKGKRPEISENINWIFLNPEEPFSTPLLATQRGEELEVISVKSDPYRLSVEKEITPLTNEEFQINSTGDSLAVFRVGSVKNIPLRNADTLKVSIFHDEEMEDQVRYIRSSLNAISEYLQLPLQIFDLSDEDLNINEDLQIWLSDEPPKTTVKAVLIYRRDSLSNSLITRGKTNQEYYLTQRLNSENIVEDHFTEQLLSLFNINEDVRREIIKYDRRVMPREEILPVTALVVGNGSINEAKDISHFLWILLGILLIAERALSAYRNQ